jgi:hypothetical protein
MLEQNFIYEALQIAFSNEHPKFPWPKKHSLQKQNKKFKKAFLYFVTEVNAYHDREVKAMVEELNAYRTRLTEEINAGASARDKARIQRNRADDAEDNLARAKTSSTIGWCVSAVLGFILVLTFLN